MKFGARLLIWTLLLSSIRPVFAQHRLSLNYVTNGQFSGQSLQGVSMSYMRKLTAKVELGVTAKYWKYAVIPLDENSVMLAVNAHQYPLMSVLHYRFTQRSWQPYLGLETGLLVSSFRNVVGTPLQTKLSYGLLPTVGLAWTKKRIGVFVEAAYLFQSINSVEVGLLSLPINNNLLLCQVGVSLTWP